LEIFKRITDAAQDNGVDIGHGFNVVVDTEIEPSHLGLREQLTVSFRRRWEDRTIIWPKSVVTKEPEMI
jgi:hypothetical protein